MSRNKRISEAVMYAVIALLGVLLYFYLIPTQIPERSSWSGDVVFSSRTFPSIIAVVMMVVSAIGTMKEVFLLLRDRPAAGPKKTAEQKKAGLRHALMTVLFCLLIILYVFLFGRIGYLIATALMIPAALWLIGSRKPWQYLCVYGFAALIYVVFRFLLNVPLP